MFGVLTKLMTGLFLLTCLMEPTHGFTLQPRPKRAVFDIIPSLASSTEPATAEGSRCLCENGSSDCVLDFKGRCTAVLNLADVNDRPADNHSRRRASERHVKKRLTSLVMRWIRMKDAERRLLAELSL